MTTRGPGVLREKQWIVDWIIYGLNPQISGDGDLSFFTPLFQTPSWTSCILRSTQTAECLPDEFSIWHKCLDVWLGRYADTGRKTTMIITLWWSWRRKNARHTYLFVHISLSRLFIRVPKFIIHQIALIYILMLNTCQTTTPFDVMVVQWFICSHVRRGRKIEIKKNRNCLNRDATFFWYFSVSH